MTLLNLRRISGGDFFLSDNWIVGNLQSAFNSWNGRLNEIWTLVTVSPQDFRGGTVWSTIVNINEGLKAWATACWSCSSQ